MTGSAKSDPRNLVLEEHRTLTARVSELDDRVAQGAVRGPSWASDLQKLTLEVLEHLKGHFSGDAEGNLFAEISMSCPHLSGRLATLASEHSKILESFRQVAERAGSYRAGDSEAELRLCLQAQAAVATLRRHEAEENEIIMRAFWEDLGAPD